MQSHCLCMLRKLPPGQVVIARLSLHGEINSVADGCNTSVYPRVYIRTLIGPELDDTPLWGRRRPDTAG